MKRAEKTRLLESISRWESMVGAGYRLEAMVRDLREVIGSFEVDDEPVCPRCGQGVDGNSKKER